MIEIVSIMIGIATVTGLPNDLDKEHKVRGGIPGEALNFHLGIGVRPERPNRGACEWTTAEFGTLVNWILNKM